MTRLFAGTSGYSYKEWRGSFYPEDLAPDAMLAFYATRLNTVEINNTFYRMPRRNVLAAWADAVPDTFRFAIKASRRITHHARLANAEEPIGFLAAALEVLEDKLGAVLFQLPPFQRKDIERLAGFAAAWPKALPAALEFRHASWFDDEVFDLMAEHGLALVVSEDEKLPAPQRTATTDWLYLRLRLPDYDEKALASWHARVGASDAERCFAYFKHEDAGRGAALAQRFAALFDGGGTRRKPAAKRAARRSRPAARAAEDG